MEGFNGKVILITGASSGIGAAAAEEFAKYGAYLALTGRNVQRLQEISNKCQKRGVKEEKILLISCDLASDDSLDKIINRTVDKFGTIDVLVNNAGISYLGNLAQITMEDMDKLYRVNLRAPLFLSQKALPHLKESKGNIVNVSSVAGKRPATVLLGYGMLKAGIDQFTKTLAVELGQFGIRVNAVNPGEIRTNMQSTIGLQGEQLEEETAAHYPLGRVAEPHEVASVIVFLASQSASFVSGTTLNVDGAVGQTSSWTQEELKDTGIYGV